MPATIACSSSSYGPYGAQAAVPHLRQIGLEYLELPISTHGQRPSLGEKPLLTSTARDNDVNETLRFVSDHGVKLASCQILTGNPVLNSARQVLKRKMEVAASLGVSVVVGDAGEPESRNELSPLYDVLRELGDHAAKLHQTYCIDMQRGLCRNHRGLLQVMSELEHPHVRINFDTGNLFYLNEEPVLEIALVKTAPYIKHVNLKDSIGEFEYWFFPALGYGGAVDFARVFQVMRDMAFPGPMSIHVDGIDGESDLPLSTYQNRVAASVNTLRECGYFNP